MIKANPILERINNDICAVYEYSITHYVQNKKRKLKDGTIKTNKIYTNKATFPFDLIQLLEIDANDKETGYIYITSKDNEVFVTKNEPTNYDEIKRIRLNYRTGLKNDYVNPETSRRSRLISLPRNILREADNKNRIKYILNTKTEKINIYLLDEE